MRLLSHTVGQRPCRAQGAVPSSAHPARPCPRSSPQRAAGSGSGAPGQCQGLELPRSPTRRGGGLCVPSPDPGTFRARRLPRPTWAHCAPALSAGQPRGPPGGRDRPWTVMLPTPLPASQTPFLGVWAMRLVGKLDPRFKSKIPAAPHAEAGLSRSAPSLPGRGPRVRRPGFHRGPCTNSCFLRARCSASFASVSSSRKSI